MNVKSWLAAHWFVFGLAILIVVSIGLRFYQLGSVPHGMSWDEAAIGYDGYSVWTVHRDEWLKIMPISFKSFGDYKAPLAIYVTGLFEVIFGQQLWVIRLPFALSGVMGVIGLVFLTRQLLKLTARIDAATLDFYALLAGFGMSLSPWHLHLTRIAMESGIALTLVIWGSYVLLKYLRGDTAGTHLIESRPLLKFLTQPMWWLAKAVVLLCLSLYAYHSTKLVTPLLVLLFGALGWRTLWKHKSETIKAALLGLVLLVPLALDSLLGHGADRLSQALIPIAGRSLFEIASELGSNLAVHFSPAFLVLGQTTVLRHGDGTWGVLLWPVFGLALAGLVSILYWFEAEHRKPRLLKLAVFSLIWILISYLPAAIGQEVPHANRTLSALPGWIWLAVVGWDVVMECCRQIPWTAAVRGTHGEANLLPKAAAGLLALSSCLFFVAYQHDYYTVFARQSAADFQDGYLQTFQFLEPYVYNRPWAPSIDRILVSNEYGQAYIFALYTLHMNPIAFNQGALSKIQFNDAKFINVGALTQPKTIVVATQSNNMPWEKADKLIFGSDGSIRFGIFVNPND